MGVNVIGMNTPPAAASRRDVLKFGAASLAVATLGPTFSHAVEHADEYGGLPMGIQSYSLRSMSLDNALAALQNELKLKEIELYPRHIAGMSTAQVVEKLKAHDVKCVSYGVIPFGKDHDANRKHFETGKALGCKNLSCDPENDPACFDSVGKLCDEYNMTVAIHPHGPGHRWVKIDQIYAAIKDVNPKIGMNDETGWLIAADEDPVRCLDVFKERTYGMHLKDFKKGPDGKLQDVPAGQGVLDVDALVKKLLEHKFDGALAVEYEGENPIVSIQQSLTRMKEAVKKAKGA
jgi:inosose dehydratase